MGWGSRRSSRCGGSRCPPSARRRSGRSAPERCCRWSRSVPAAWGRRSASRRSSSASRRCPSSRPPFPPGCSSSGSVSVARSWLAGLADAVGCALALVAPSLWVLGVAVFLLGPSGAVFLLARQSYLTAAAPVALRARAMSTLGGVTRIGLFLGPLDRGAGRRPLGAAGGLRRRGGRRPARRGPGVAHARPRCAPPGCQRRARAGAGRPGGGPEPPGAAHRRAGRARHRPGPVLTGRRRAAVGRARRARRRADLARLRRRRVRRGRALLARPARSWTATAGSGSPCP